MSITKIPKRYSAATALRIDVFFNHPGLDLGTIMDHTLMGSGVLATHLDVALWTYFVEILCELNHQSTELLISIYSAALLIVGLQIQFHKLLC